MNSNSDSPHGVRQNTPEVIATILAFQVRNVKVNFSKFSGMDVVNWIFKADKFFDYY